MTRIFRWIGILLGGLVGLLAVAIAAIYLLSEQAMQRVYDIAPEAIVVPGDPAAIERGSHLVNTVAFCTECHGADLGGQIMESDPIVGTLVAANLTRGQGGAASTFTDADFVRAIRHGVNPEGKPLIVMPSASYYHLSDYDLGAIIAYIRNVPPVDNDLPGVTAGLLGRLSIVIEPFTLQASLIDHAVPPPPAPEPGVTAEYGEYLAFNCRTCHGDDMGGEAYDLGGGGNLTPGGAVGNWTAEQFIQTIRTRVTPEGRQIDAEMAPLFRTIGSMTDDELTAIYLYIQSLPPVIIETEAP
jgi:mono/diheme cytochrome c family protein